MHESGCSTAHEPSLILVAKGPKRVETVTSWERSRNVAVTWAVSASGNLTPTFLTFPLQHLTKDEPCVLMGKQITSRLYSG